jgi:hypothetical protein
VIAVSVIAIASLATADSGEELYLSFTNKLDYRRLDQSQDEEEAFRNRAELSAYRGIFEAWIRLESLQVSDASIYDPYGAGQDGFIGEQRVDETEVTKRSFSVETDQLQAVVGDFAYVFGHGLMLSIFEDEELNFDTRLEGICGSLRHDYGTVTAVGGSQDENRFRGLFLEPETWGPLRLGGGFVEAWGGSEDTDILSREQHFGGLGELNLGPATLHGEFVRRDFPDEDVKAGDGRFVSALVSVKNVTVSGEYRDFFKFEHEYHDPPTTLRQHTWTLLNRVNGTILTDLPDENVSGYLVEGEYTHDLFTTFQVSFSELDGNVRAVDRDDKPDDFWELYGEAKGTWQEKVFFTAAAAESESEIGSLFEERISGFGEVVFDWRERNSLSLGLEWSEIQASDRATQSFRFPEEFRERIFSASYGRSPWLNLTLSYEDTTEDDPTESRDDWVSVLAEIAIADNHDVNLSWGSERGGWKCTGGVCFFEPEFEGLKVKWVARY